MKELQYICVCSRHGHILTLLYIPVSTGSSHKVVHSSPEQDQINRVNPVRWFERRIDRSRQEPVLRKPSNGSVRAVQDLEERLLGLLCLTIHHQSSYI